MKDDRVAAPQHGAFAAATEQIRAPNVARRVVLGRWDQLVVHPLMIAPMVLLLGCILLLLMGPFLVKGIGW